VLGCTFAYKDHYGHQTSTSLIGIACVLLYTACNAFSISGVLWIIVSEIFPLHIRAKAIGICTFCNWAFDFIVSSSFLSLKEAIQYRVFWMYCALDLLLLMFVLRYVPETKGRSLEEVQHLFR
jgi:major inositol transporter-like SP family MFS transporter